MWFAVIGLTVLANILIAVMAYKKNPESATHVLLAALSIISLLWTVFNYLALAPGPELTRLFWVRTVMFVTTPYGSVIMLLAMTFPEARIPLQKSKLILLTIFNLITAGFALSPYMFTRVENLEGGSFMLYPGPAIVLFAIGFMGLMMVGFYILIKKFIHSSGLLKKQLLMFLAGLVISFTLLSLTNFVAVVVFGTIQLTALGPPFTLILFAFTIYAIVKHRFLDITYLIARSVSYFLLLVVVVSLYALILFNLSAILPSDVDRTLLSSMLAVALAFSFNPLRTLLEKVTDNFFFQGRYITQVLLNQLTHLMASEIDIGRLSQELLETITAEMRLTKAAFILTDANQVENIATVGYQATDLSTPTFVNLLAGLENESVMFDELLDASAKDIWRGTDVEAIFSLKTKAGRVGWMILGPKASGNPFEGQDVELLEILAPQAAVALTNAQSYQRIKDFNLTLEKKVEERTQELQQTQARELQKAGELLKLKDEFVFIATHDLGTPVTAIKGYTSLLKQSKDKYSPDTQENIEAVVEATERLSKLTNDLLQVARSDSGTIKVNTEAVDVRKIIEAAVKEVKNKALERKIEVESKFYAQECLLQADPDKLAEVIENLLSNAIKYNKEGGKVTVKTQLKTDKVEISVADTGLGIPQAQQTKIFQKFFRAQQPGAKDVNGTGLGLFVVKMLVNKMGGEISFTSQEGQGSTFVVSLPKV